MSKDENQLDLMLEAQLSVEFLNPDLNREQTYSFCLNSMALGASSVLEILHYRTFLADKTESKNPKEYAEQLEEERDDIRESLADVLNYTFCLYNELKLDVPEFSQIMEFKEAMPMLIRSDKVLALHRLLTVIGRISTVVWLELDQGLKTPMAKQSELPDATDKDLEEDLLRPVLELLAIVDTLCHHTGEGIRGII